MSTSAVRQKKKKGPSKTYKAKRPISIRRKNWRRFRRLVDNSSDVYPRSARKVGRFRQVYQLDRRFSQKICRGLACAMGKTSISRKISEVLDNIPKRPYASV
jgi:hypothetical protein